MTKDANHPWLQSLNPPQAEAAAYGEGPLLIVAGAGSGKTRVIVHRIAHLIGARGVDPWNILAVTFTNKAAEEMHSRVAELLGAGSGRVWVSTFHSLGAQILRRHAELFGYTRSFVIYDETDQLSLLKRIIKERGLDPKATTPRAVRGVIDYTKREALVESEVEGLDDPRVQKFLPIIREYQERLIAANALDFGDLLLLTQKLFEKHPLVLEEYRERFRHILVDEYQDTNRVQYLIVKALAGGSGNICVVGDEDQSIYGWRGADIGNILSFEEDFPNARVVMLEQNYRSTGTIIEAASELIGNNRERKPKRLWTGNPEGDPILQHQAVDEKDEARWVVEEVLRLKGLGRGLSDVAVFYRTHAQSRVLEDELRNLNLAYTVYGGTRFYDRKEIKDVLAYLKFLLNPGDEVSLLRIINTPARGVGGRTVEIVADEKRRSGAGWIEAIGSCVDRGLVGGRSAGGLRRFAELIGDLAGMLDGPIAALGEAVIERSGYKSMLVDEGTIEARSREENLEELLNAMSEHEARSDTPGLAGFLEKVSLATDLDGFDYEAGQLTLMTLHSAKGLEFPVVFMVGMVDGVFPHIRSLIQDAEEDDLSGIEEERRLCYVGMTRARELLVMTWSAQRSIRGSKGPAQPSQFLSEVPARYTVRAGGKALRRPSRPGRGRKTAERSLDFGDSEIVYDEPMALGGMDHPSGVTLEPGDRVRHRDYGVGVIKRFEESGESLKVVVKFARGTKKFLARTAPLEPAD